MQVRAILLGRMDRTEIMCADL